MQFDILTLFPEAFDSFIKTSMIGKAIEKKIIETRIYDIRDFSTNKHKKVDDIPYGGGAGMLLTPQPLFDAIRFVQKKSKKPAPVIFFTPSESILDQSMVEDFAIGKIPETLRDKKFSDLKIQTRMDGFFKKKEPYERYILLCGHYEGIDQRVRDQLVDLEISIGNFVLTGGELPSQIFMDSVSRLIPGVLGNEVSHQGESFSREFGRSMLEYPHYTRPEVYESLVVPEILLSGHHANIEVWKKEKMKKI